MTGLAGAIDIQQRTPDVVIADLHGADSLIRHVTVGARDAGSGVDTLVPHLEFRVLRLQGGSALRCQLPVPTDIYLPGRWDEIFTTCVWSSVSQASTPMASASERASRTATSCVGQIA